MDYKKIQEVLDEKYRYLFISEFSKIYDILEINVQVELNQNEIYELWIDFKIDDTRANNGDAYDIGRMLREANDNIREFLYKYPVNPKTAKIDTNFENFIVHDGLFLEFDYVMDDKHNMLVSFRVDYEGK